MPDFFLRDYHSIRRHDCNVKNRNCADFIRILNIVKLNAYLSIKL
jgi:hypothetical protein